MKCLRNRDRLDQGVDKTQEMGGSFDPSGVSTSSQHKHWDTILELTALTRLLFIFSTALGYFAMISVHFDA